MKLLFILFCFFAVDFSCFSQGWQHTFGGSRDDVGYYAQQTIDGGFIVTGQTSSFSSNMEYDLYLLKTNSNGALLWQKTFGGVNFDSGASLKQTSDGGFIILGTTLVNSISYDIFILKTDSNGIEQWTQSIANSLLSERAYSIQITSDGGFIIVGSKWNPGSLGSSDVYVIKTNEQGVVLWEQTYGGNNSTENGYQIKETTDGGFIISGSTYVNPSDSNSGDVLLLKINNSGLLQWQNTFGGINGDEGYDICQTQDGGFIISGCKKCSSQGFTYLIKTNQNGGLEWETTYGEPGWSFDSFGVLQDNDGGFVILGNKVNSNSEIHLFKMDPLGILQWNYQYGGSEWSYGRSLVKTNDGGFLITGYSESFSSINPGELYLLRTDGQGILTLNEELTSEPRELLKVVNILGQETNFSENELLIYIYKDGSTEKKFFVNL
jgi:hypothetical protein